jgi:hypothetical protein
VKNRNRKLTCGILLLLGVWRAHAQVDVLTQHNDNQRSGLNRSEVVLTQQTVRKNFGKLWTLYSDAKIMTQPLYVSNLTSAECPKACNVVIFASMKGTIYAYKADQKPLTANDTLIWARYLGDPQLGNKYLDKWATDDPWWGILGTPVIDRFAGSIYAVVWNRDGQYRIYELDLATGNIKKGPVVVQGTVGTVSFVEKRTGWRQLRKQRAALLLSEGVLYVAFGGDNDQGLAGWLFAYDAGALTLKAVWSPTSGGRNGGIWQSGQGPAADNSGNIYLQTGDGEFDAQRQLFGNSLVRLRLGAGGFTVTDYFTPCEQAFLDRCDYDLGSAAPLLFNDSVVAGGKTGKLYLMRADKLGQYVAGPETPKSGSCKVIPECSEGPRVVQKWRGAIGHIHGAPVFWNGPGGQSWLYVMGEGDRLKAFPFVNGKFDVAAQRHSQWQPGKPGKQSCGGSLDYWMPGGILSLSSNGDAAGTGILWALVPANGDATTYRGVKGMLLALNAEDVSQELWRSQAKDAAASNTKDSFGLLARFVPPTIANGKVFVATAGDKEPLSRWCNQRPTIFPKNYGLVVYGLK